MRVVLISDTHHGMTSKTNSLLRKFYFNIKELEPDVILHTGDWSANSQLHFEEGIKLLRKVFPDTPIVGTDGNHDYHLKLNKGTDGYVKSKEWHKFKSIQTILDYHDRVFDDYGIEQYRSFKIKKQDEYGFNYVSFFAYQSWYATNSPPSNDYHYFPDHFRENVHQIMMDHSKRQFNKLTIKLKQSGKGAKRVILTHFSPFPHRSDTAGMRGSIEEFERIMTYSPYAVCYGHSHYYQNEIIDGVKVLNCGSDYDKPKHIFFEVE